MKPPTHAQLDVLRFACRYGWFQNIDANWQTIKAMTREGWIKPHPTMTIGVAFSARFSPCMTMVA